MRSKWYELKTQAIKLRQKGLSLRKIEKTLQIPRSTLSGWLSKIVLTEDQKKQLRERLLRGLIKARTKAVIWHNQQKENRLKQAKNLALKSLSEIDLKNRSVLELALAMLYLGEGAKNNSTCIGNSNPLILRFFIKALIHLYRLDCKKIKCELHLRADQNPHKIKEYWAKELGLPLSSFYSVSVDKRTVGKSTYAHYNGVCVVRCGNIAIQRRLIYLSQLFCEEITNKRAVSSAGRASA